MSTILLNGIRIGDGLVRSKSILGIIDHYGLYAGGDQVIENHPDYGVRLVSLSEFFNGRALEKVVRFPGNDWERQVAIQKAYEMIGSRYDVFDFNCEHFVNLVHRVGMKSSQIETAKNLVLGAMAVWVVWVIFEG